jgi:hypothetical protein
VISLVPSVTSETPELSDLSLTEEDRQQIVDVARSAGQGLTLSASDEAEAIIRSLIGDKSYSENINQIRSSIKRFDEENPKASTAAYIGGIIPTLAMTIPVLATKMSIATGSAGLGALEGFLTGEGLQGRIDEGALGAIFGRIGGGMFEKASPKVKEFLTSLKNKLTSTKLPKPRNDQEAMAKKILEMRAAGKSKEVTDDMMKIADDQYMSKNTPLDMSPEARLARAADRIPVYHRTSKDFDAFDLSESQSGPAIFVGPNAQNLQQGHNRKSVGDNIMPLLLKTNNPLELDEFNLREMQDRYASGDSEFPLAFSDETAKKLKNADFDAIISKDIYGNSLSNFDVDEIAVLKPENVRSRFARMDPEFSNLKNLNAAMAAGIPLGALGFFADNEEYYQDM